MPPEVLSAQHIPAVITHAFARLLHNPAFSQESLHPFLSGCQGAVGAARVFLGPSPPWGQVESHKAKATWSCWLSYLGLSGDGVRLPVPLGTVWGCQPAFCTGQTEVRVCRYVDAKQQESLEWGSAAPSPGRCGLLPPPPPSLALAAKVLRAGLSEHRVPMSRTPSKALAWEDQHPQCRVRALPAQTATQGGMNSQFMVFLARTCLEVAHPVPTGVKVRMPLF